MARKPPLEPDEKRSPAWQVFSEQRRAIRKEFWEPRRSIGHCLRASFGIENVPRMSPFWPRAELADVERAAAIRRGVPTGPRARLSSQTPVWKRVVKQEFGSEVQELRPMAWDITPFPESKSPRL